MSDIQRGKRGAWVSRDGYVVAKGVKTTGGERAGDVVLRVSCGECPSANVGEVREVEDLGLRVVAKGPITPELRKAIADVRVVAKRAAPPQPRSYWSTLDETHWYRFCCRRCDGVGQLDGHEILDAIARGYRTVRTSAVLKSP